jgi:hypothetical protein
LKKAQGFVEDNLLLWERTLKILGFLGRFGDF